MNLSKLLQSEKKIKGIKLTDNKFNNFKKIAKFIGDNTDTVDIEDIKTVYNTLFRFKATDFKVLSEDEETLVIEVQTYKTLTLNISKKNSYKVGVSVLTPKNEMFWNWNLLVGLIEIHKMCKFIFPEEDSIYYRQKIFMTMLNRKIYFRSVIEEFMYQILLMEVVDVVKKHNETVEFNKNATKSIATAFDTKKVINKETLKAMETSDLNKMFANIEFDNEVSLDKLHIYEKALKELLTTTFSTLDKAKLTFRLRKLGKHNATGIYENKGKNVVIDFRSSESTVHEFAHALDFSKETPISYNQDFAKIARFYREELDTETLTSSKAKYYKNIHEIFARAFEYNYFLENGVKEEISKDLSKPTFDYKPFEKIKDEVVEYFSNLVY